MLLTLCCAARTVHVWFLKISISSSSSSTSSSSSSNKPNVTSCVSSSPLSIDRYAPHCARVCVCILDPLFFIKGRRTTLLKEEEEEENEISLLFFFNYYDSISFLYTSVSLSVSVCVCVCVRVFFFFFSNICFFKMNLRIERREMRSFIAWEKRLDLASEGKGYAINWLTSLATILLLWWRGGRQFK